MQKRHRYRGYSYFHADMAKNNNREANRNRFKKAGVMAHHRVAEKKIGAEDNQKRASQTYQAQRSFVFLPAPRSMQGFRQKPKRQNQNQEKGNEICRFTVRSPIMTDACNGIPEKAGSAHQWQRRQKPFPEYIDGRHIRKMNF